MSSGEVKLKEDLKSAKDTTPTELGSGIIVDNPALLKKPIVRLSLLRKYLDYWEKLSDTLPLKIKIVTPYVRLISENVFNGEIKDFEIVYENFDKYPWDLVSIVNELQRIQDCTRFKYNGIKFNLNNFLKFFENYDGDVGLEEYHLVNSFLFSLKTFLEKIVKQLFLFENGKIFDPKNKREILAEEALGILEAEIKQMDLSFFPMKCVEYYGKELLEAYQFRSRLKIVEPVLQNQQPIRDRAATHANPAVALNETKANQDLNYKSSIFALIVYLYEHRTLFVPEARLKCLKCIEKYIKLKPKVSSGGDMFDYAQDISDFEINYIALIDFPVKTIAKELLKLTSGYPVSYTYMHSHDSEKYAQDIALLQKEQLAVTDENILFKNYLSTLQKYISNLVREKFEFAKGEIFGRNGVTEVYTMKKPMSAAFLDLKREIEKSDLSVDLEKYLYFLARWEIFGRWQESEPQVVLPMESRAMDRTIQETQVVSVVSDVLAVDNSRSLESTETKLEPKPKPTPEKSHQPAETKIEPTAEVTPEVTAEVTAEPTPEPTPAPTPATPGVTPEVTPEPTPAPTPEVTAEPTPAPKTEVSSILSQQNHAAKIIEIQGSGSKATLAQDDFKRIVEGLGSKFLETLILKSNNLGDEGAEILAQCLKDNTSLTYLNLDYSQIGEKGGKALANALKLNSSLQVLILSHNNFNKVVARGFVDALITNKQLKMLYLDGCGFNNLKNDRESSVIPQFFSVLLKTTTTLEVLSLRSNNFNTVGATFIAEGLKHNKSLRRLYLDNCNLRTKGLKAIADALKDNRTLEYISLTYNKIGKQGIDYLVEVLSKNKTLTFVVRGDDGSHSSGIPTDFPYKPHHVNDLKNRLAFYSKPSSFYISRSSNIMFEVTTDVTAETVEKPGQKKNKKQDQNRQKKEAAGVAEPWSLGFSETSLVINTNREEENRSAEQKASVDVSPSVKAKNDLLQKIEILKAYATSFEGDVLHKRNEGTTKCPSFQQYLYAKLQTIKIPHCNEHSIKSIPLFGEFIWVKLFGKDESIYLAEIFNRKLPYFNSFDDYYQNAFYNFIECMPNLSSSLDALSNDIESLRLLTDPEKYLSELGLTKKDFHAIPFLGKELWKQILLFPKPSRAQSGEPGQKSKEKEKEKVKEKEKEKVEPKPSFTQGATVEQKGQADNVEEPKQKALVPKEAGKDEEQPKPDFRPKQPEQHTFEKATNLGGILEDLKYLQEMSKILLYTPPEIAIEQKEIMAVIKENEVLALLNLITHLMDEINENRSATLLPRELAYQFRQQIYHNANFIKKLLPESATIRALAFQLYFYLNGKLSQGINIALEHETDEIIAMLNSLMFQSKDNRSASRDEPLENTVQACKESLCACESLLNDSLKHQDILLAYYDEVQKLVQKNSNEMLESLMGSFYSEYSRRFRGDSEFAVYSARFEKYWETGRLARHRKKEESREASVESAVLVPPASQTMYLPLLVARGHATVASNPTQGMPLYNKPFLAESSPSADRKDGDKGKKNPS